MLSGGKGEGLSALLRLLSSGYEGDSLPLHGGRGRAEKALLS